MKIYHECYEFLFRKLIKSSCFFNFFISIHKPFFGCKYQLYSYSIIQTSNNALCKLSIEPNWWQSATFVTASVPNYGSVSAAWIRTIAPHERFDASIIRQFYRGDVWTCCCCWCWCSAEADHFLPSWNYSMWGNDNSCIHCRLLQTVIYEIEISVVCCWEALYASTYCVPLSFVVDGKLSLITDIRYYSLIL